MLAHWDILPFWKLEMTFILSFMPLWIHVHVSTCKTTLIKWKWSQSGCSVFYLTSAIWWTLYNTLLLSRLVHVALSQHDALAGFPYFKLFHASSNIIYMCMTGSKLWLLQSGSHCQYISIASWEERALCTGCVFTFSSNLLLHVYIHYQYFKCSINYIFFLITF